jgi:sporulation protein YlmC with PRC-barrel domain
MKATIWYGATVAVVGLAAAILGQDEITSTSSSSSSYVPTSKLVGRKITSAQGEEIGVIKDVVFDRSNGRMAYTVVSTGDAQTGGGKIVVVPWTVYSPTSDASARPLPRGLTGDVAHPIRSRWSRATSGRRSGLWDTTKAETTLKNVPNAGKD